MSAILTILGLDPGLRRCGWGLIQVDGARLSCLGHGILAPPTDAAMSLRLAALFQGVVALTAQHAPHEAAIEETFVNANPKSALSLGQARGAVLAALGVSGLKAAEYAPTQIKKAVVGNGQADKDQVAFMVARLLPNAKGANKDSADALAAALAHAAYRRAPQIG